MVVKTRGEDAWRYSQRCSLCKGAISADEEVYIVGAEVFHKGCFEWLLQRPEREFKEIISRISESARKELEKEWKLRHGALIPMSKIISEVPKKPEDEIKEFKRKLWVMFHAVEEHDWERAKLPEFQQVLKDLREEAKKLSEKKLIVYDWAIDPLFTLERAIEEENAERALWAIATILFWLDPDTSSRPFRS